MTCNTRCVALLATRWIARISGLLLTLLVLVIYIGEGPPPLRILLHPIQIGIWLVVAGLLAGWKYEGWGGLIALSGAATMFIYERIAWHHWLGGVFPLFLLPAILLLASKIQSLRCKTGEASPNG